MAQEKIEVKLVSRADTKDIKTFRNELKSLDRQYGIINKAGKSYSNSLEGIERKHEIVSKQISKYNDLLKVQKSRQAELQQSLELNKNKLKEISNVDGDTTVAKEKLNRIIEAQEREYRALSTAIDETSGSIRIYTEHEKILSQTKIIEGLKERQESYRKTAEKIKTAGEKIHNLGDLADNLGGKFIKLGVPVVGLGGTAIKMAVDYESAFAGVRKTVDATDEEFKKMFDDILLMSTQMPKAATEIANVAESAGQLGIAKEDILEFTKVILQLSDSTNLASEEGATALARFANVAKTSSKDYSKLGSTLVALGNTSATTERDIMNMASRIVGAGHQVGLSEHQIFAYAATLSSLGVEAEAGGSAFSKLLIRIQLACSKGGKELSKFAKIAGYSVKEFRDRFKNDAANATKDFIAGLGAIQEKGGDVISILDDMDISEVRLRDSVLKLTSGNDVLTNSLNNAKKAWEDNTALGEEAGKRYATTESKVKMLRNELTKQAITLGTQLLPYAIDFIKVLSSMINGFSELPDWVKKGAIALSGISIAGGVAMKVFGNLAKGVGTFIKYIGNAKLTRLDKALNIAESASKMGTLTSASDVAIKSTTLLGKAGSFLASNWLPIAGIVGAATVAYKGFQAYQSINNSTIMKSREEMSLWEKAVAMLTGKVVLSNEELIKQGFKFAELKGVSEETADAYQKLTDDVFDFGITLKKINLDKTFSEEEQQNVFSRFDNFVSRIKKELENNEKEFSENYKKLLSADGVFDVADAKALKVLKNIGIKTKEEVIRIENEINDIKSKIRAEGNRALTADEEKMLSDRYKRLAELEATYLAKNEEELAVIKAQFNARTDNLTKERAEKLIGDERANGLKRIENIKVEYEGLIATAKEGLKNLSGVEKEEAEKAIAELEKNKQIALDKEIEKFNQLIDIVKEKYPQMAEQIDLETGKMLTNKEKKYAKELADYTSHLIGIQTVNKTGWQYIYNDTTGTFDMMYVQVDELSGKIVGVYNSSTAEIRGKNDELINSLTNLRSNHSNSVEGIIANMDVMARGIANGADQGDVKLNELQRNFELLKSKTDSAGYAIVNFNGKSIRVKIDGSNAQATLSSIQNQLNQISKGVTASIGGVATLGRLSTIRPYFRGTNYAEGGLSKVNELGWELFDELPGNSFARYKTGEYAYLNPGTRVTPHLASTEMMRQDIRTEVNRQLSYIDYNNKYFNRDNFKNHNVYSSNNTNDTLINLIVNAIKEGFKNVRIENIVDPENDIKGFDLDYELAMLKLRKGM